MKGYVTREATIGASAWGWQISAKHLKEKTTTNLSVDPFQAWATDQTRDAASAASPTDGSESPCREILFVPAQRVFQQDVPTEGEVNYEQTLHKGIWSWIWCSTKHRSYSLKIVASYPRQVLRELIKHWTAWGQASAQSEKEKYFFLSCHCGRICITYLLKRIIINFWWSAENKFFHFHANT